MFLALPDYPGAKLTLKRVANCYRNRWEMRHLSTELRSYPLKLTVEPIDTCNLSCPACFTGDGQTSRPRKTMPMDFYQGLRDEAGDYLWQIEFCNGGEPLLNKQIATMIRAATDRGIGTLVSTNFSFRFDERRAEDLVRSGLTVLGVSIDGTQQETYEQYRVGGNLETVLANCRKIRDAKRRLGLCTPHMRWSFHVFPHNVYDVATARTMAPELDLELVVEKGWVVGDEWERNGFFKFRHNVKPFPDRHHAERLVQLLLAAAAAGRGSAPPPAHHRHPLTVTDSARRRRAAARRSCGAPPAAAPDRDPRRDRDGSA